MNSTKPRAKNNRTIVLDDARKEVLARELAPAPRAMLSPEDAAGRVFRGDCMKIMEHLPDGFAAMAVLDPPYNLTKTYNNSTFRSRSTNLPHQVVIDMGESRSVGGFRILPRTDRNANGRIRDFRFFVKETPFKF